MVESSIAANRDAYQAELIAMADKHLADWDNLKEIKNDEKTNH